MNRVYLLPYGKSNLEFNLDDQLPVELFVPVKLNAHGDQSEIVSSAIRKPLYNSGLPEKVSPGIIVAISINDKTRPVPNNLLFPPLLDALKAIGVQKEKILILIATGTHIPMPAIEHSLILTDQLLSQFKVISHNCDDETNLTLKGTTTRGTSVFVNTLFDRADIKIVVGDIEPHHFAGFSGGYKSASIGLCGRKTINQNHSLLQHPMSCVGRYEDNPLRQDIEEIGQLIGVDFALNAILNEKKEILYSFFGKPKDVLKAGIKVIRETELTSIDEQFDLVIASAGGYPKDINLYQAQKALTHASLFCKDGGTVLLAAACEEGVGSQAYVEFMDGMTSHTEASAKFIENEFKVGPHKAFQFAAIAKRIKFQIKSEIDPKIMQKLLIQPITNIEKSINEIINKIDHPIRIAVVPYATATIPRLSGDQK